MVRIPWDGKAPIGSKFWMDWFNYYLQQGMEWEEAARRSWIEVEQRHHLDGRLFLSFAEQIAAQHPSATTQDTHFERPIARWIDPFTRSNGSLRCAAWARPSPDNCVCVAWTRRPQRLQITLDLHVDLLQPDKIENAVEKVLEEVRVLTAVSTVVSSSLSRGYKAVCTERRVLERILWQSLQKRIHSPIFAVRVVFLTEATASTG